MQENFLQKIMWEIFWQNECRKISCKNIMQEIFWCTKCTYLSCKICRGNFMLKGHISSNFHGAGKFPTTNMKVLWWPYVWVSYKQIADRDTPYILILSFMYFVFIIISCTLSLSLVSYWRKWSAFAEPFLLYENYGKYFSRHGCYHFHIWSINVRNIQHFDALILYWKYSMSDPSYILLVILSFLYIVIIIWRFFPAFWQCDS